MCLLFLSSVKQQLSPVSHHENGLTVWDDEEFKRPFTRDFPGGQWLRLLHTVQVAWVPSLVGKLRFHMSHIPHIPGWGVKTLHIILHFLFFGQKKKKQKQQQQQKTNQNISNIVTDSIKTFKKILKKKEKTFPQPLFPDSGSPTGDATWRAVSQHLLPYKLHVPFWLSNFPSGNSLLQEIL